MIKQIFKDINNYPNLSVAIVHPSQARSSTNRRQFQRFEFLGDAVLGLIIGDILMQDFPAASEGELTLKRAKIVAKKSLSEWAKQSELIEKINVGDNPKGKPKKIIADMVEAFIGCLYHDAGLECARNLVKEIYEYSYSPKNPSTKKSKIESSDNSKNELQSLIHQSHSGVNADYEVTSQSGPAHSPEFLVNVKVGGIVIGSGKGRNRKEAEKLAANEAIAYLRKYPEFFKRLKSWKNQTQPVVVLDDDDEDIKSDSTQEHVIQAFSSPSYSNEDGSSRQDKKNIEDELSTIKLQLRPRKRHRRE